MLYLVYISYLDLLEALGYMETLRRKLSQCYDASANYTVTDFLK